MSNELKISTIKKKAKEVNKYENHEFEDGQILKFMPIFPENKVDDLLNDFQSLMKESEEINFKLDEGLVYSLIYILCVKHFTHLGKQIPDGLANHIEYMQNLNDAGYFKPIIKEVFLGKEIQKVINQITDKVVQLQFLKNMANQVQLKVKNLELQNKELLTSIK